MASARLEASVERVIEWGPAMALRWPLSFIRARWITGLAGKSSALSRELPPIDELPDLGDFAALMHQSPFVSWPR